MIPQTFRPRRSLTTALVLSSVLVGASILGWVTLPADIQALFTWPQILTLVFFIAVMIAIMLGIGLSYVRVEAEGLRFRNGIRSYELPWAEVHGMRFTEHDPWAYLELADGVQRPLLGIQRTDRERAEADFAELVAAWRKAVA